MAFDDPFNTDATNLDGETSNNLNYLIDEDTDPAADFLEREKRELGDITGNVDTNSFEDPFSTQSTNNNLLTNGNYRYHSYIFLFYELF